jgi:outer membrane protein TolC
MARRNEPRLKVLQREIASADAASRLTRRARLPEVVLGAEARNYTGNGNFRQAEVMLGFTLPWGNRAKYRRDYERDRNRVVAAEQDAADYALGIAEELHALTVRIDAARREALAYRDDIIPRTEQALQSAQSSWMSGRSLFLEVMESRRLLLEARLTYHRAITEQYNLLVELVLCCGLGDLESLEMIGATPPAAVSSHPVSTSR